MPLRPRNGLPIAWEMELRPRNGLPTALKMELCPRNGLPITLKMELRSRNRLLITLKMELRSRNRLPIALEMKFGRPNSIFNGFETVVSLREHTLLCQKAPIPKKNGPRKRSNPQVAVCGVSWTSISRRINYCRPRSASTRSYAQGTSPRPCS